MQSFIRLLYLVIWVQVSCSSAGVHSRERVMEDSLMESDLAELSMVPLDFNSCFEEEYPPLPGQPMATFVEPQPNPDESLTQPGETLLSEEMIIKAIAEKFPDLDIDEDTVGEYAAINDYPAANDYPAINDNVSIETTTASWDSMDTTMSMSPDMPIQEPTALGQPLPSTATSQTPQPTLLSTLAEELPVYEGMLPLVDTTTKCMDTYMKRYRETMSKGIFVLLEFVTRDEREILEVVVCFGRRRPKKVSENLSKRACKFELKNLNNQGPAYTKVLKWIEETKPNGLCQLFIDVCFDVETPEELTHARHISSLVEVVKIIRGAANYTNILIASVYLNKKCCYIRTSCNVLPSTITTVPQTIVITEASEPLLAQLLPLLPWQSGAALFLNSVYLHELRIVFAIPVSLKYFSIMADPLENHLPSSTITRPLSYSIEHLLVVGELLASRKGVVYSHMLNLLQAAKTTLEVNMTMYTEIVYPNLYWLHFTCLIVYSINITAFEDDTKFGNAPFLPDEYAAAKRLEEIVVKL